MKFRARPSYCCHRCGEPIGWIGRAFQWFGLFHRCTAVSSLSKGDILDIAMHDVPCLRNLDDDDLIDFARAIERANGIGA